MNRCPVNLQWILKGGEVGMNLINYNQAIEALDKERQFLLNREQYGAENVLVHHAINVIAELPIIRQPEIVRCKDCWKREFDNCPFNEYSMVVPEDDFFCADGERK